MDFLSLVIMYLLQFGICKDSLCRPRVYVEILKIKNVCCSTFNFNVIRICLVKLKFDYLTTYFT